MSPTQEEDGVPARWSASTTYADMWVDPEQDPRDALGDASDERSTLRQYLDVYRMTMEMKCEGLDAAQLAERSVPPSTMSLLGIVRHMADVEQYWFRRVMGGEQVSWLFRTDDDRDAAWDGAVGDPETVARAWDAWRAAVAAANELLETMDDLGTEGRQRDGSPVQLREVLVHMVEEYARHCGHADLLRERVDGRVGQ